MLYSRQLWQEIRSRWKGGQIPDDPIVKASEWFFLSRSSYASDIRHGGFIGYTQGRNMCKTFRNTVEQLNKVGEQVKTWIIENLDFKTCITRFDSPDTVFYCDMPYYLPGKREKYQDRFTFDNHKILAKLLANIKGRALVSHYKDDVVSELYKGWNRYEFQSFKGSSKAEPGAEKPKTQEILYFNFEPEVRTRSLFDG
jgi:DNA adenine methylase